MNLSEQGHVVNVLPAQDINTARTCKIFSMENYKHATIHINVGAITSGTAVTLEECTASGGTGNTAIAFNYYGETTSDKDILGARTAATTAGFTTSTNNNTFYNIELDASELSDGSPWVKLTFSDPGASAIVSSTAVLTGARYGTTQSPTILE